jgi:hypothetical protein
MIRLIGTLTIMNTIFDWCTDLLELLAPRLGMAYKELDVGLFVIVMSGMVIMLIFWAFLFDETCEGRGGRELIRACDVADSCGSQRACLFDHLARMFLAPAASARRLLSPD